MTCVRPILLLILLVGGLSWVTAAAQDAPALPPLEQCQGEVLQLKAALVEWQARAVAAEAQIAQRELAAQRQAYESRVRDVVHPPAETVFDWSRLRFVQAPPPKEQP